jgi:hypothetical protein
VTEKAEPRGSLAIVLAELGLGKGGQVRCPACNAARGLAISRWSGGETVGLSLCECPRGDVRAAIERRMQELRLPRKETS